MVPILHAVTLCRGLGRAAAFAAVVGCTPASTATLAPADHHDPDLTPAQTQALAELVAAVEADPNDFEARKASGLAHMRLTLAGILRFQTRAEADLEAAFELDPTDALLTRSLGRFYNLRAVAGNRDKADWQVRVYAAHLRDTPVDEMSTSQFTAWAFSRLGTILAARNRGNLLGALSQIKELEAQLQARTEREPDDVELHALAGNFAFFFAGNVPFDKKDRVQTAVRHFEVVRARWEQMRAGARHPRQCPNTRENFMFELAEGYLTLGRVDEAAPIYEELTTIREPYTRAKEQVAFVAAERLRNAQTYAGKMELMPPWPSDGGNCIVCHAFGSDIPMHTLHAEPPIVLDQIPRREPAPPVAWP